MSYCNFPVRSKNRELVSVVGYITGANDADPTNTECEGVAVTRTGEGVYRFTFAENNGTFLGCHFALGAATPADVDDYSVVWDTFDTTNNRIDVTVYSAVPAAADLVANQFLSFTFNFGK